MEQEILTILQTISWAGVAGLFVWKILTPIINFLLKKANGSLPKSAEAKLDLIKKNDLTHIADGIDDLKDIMREMVRDNKSNQLKMIEHLVWIKSRINGKM